MKLLRVLAALLLLAAAASASLSPLLALIAGWAGLIVALLAGVDWYRSRVEQTVCRFCGERHVLSCPSRREQRIASIYERSGRLVLRRRAKETS